MLRRIASVTAVLAVTTFVAAPAGATVPPPTGSWSCAITGNFVLTPPLTYTPSAGAVHVRTAGRGSNCDSSGVTGGKAPISDVFIRGLLAFLPNGSCHLVVVDPGAPHNLYVKFQGRNAKNHTMTVANAKAVATHVALTFVTWDFVYALPATGAFAGATLHLHAVLDNPSQWGTDCAGAGVQLLRYTGTITVP